jgi:hypothetical protein
MNTSEIVMLTVKCKSALHSDLKVQAALEKRRIWELVEEALKQYLSKSGKKY